MSRGTHDPGLRAVARVRGVREQDSRLGLQQALREQRVHETRAAELRDRLDGARGAHLQSVGSFLAMRASLEAVGAALRAVEAQRDTSRVISETAYVRWQSDKARLAAVESLLERRDAERRAEAARREARDLDEIAIQRWQRGGA